MSNPEAARFHHVPRLTPPPVGSEVSEETLWAGDILVSDRRIRMTTVLGSCVSVCLYDNLRGYGGMNHFLLPSPGEGGRHGAWSIRELYQRMLNLGSHPRNLRAKVFGGGSPLALTNDASAIGPANARVAFDSLEKLGVAIVGDSVGQNTGMRIYFENWSGLVLVRPHRERSEP